METRGGVNRLKLGSSETGRTHFCEAISVKHERLVLQGPRAMYEVTGFIYSKLTSFACKGRTLLIFHYSGHGIPDENHQLLLTANRSASSPTMKWQVIRNRIIFTNNPSDEEFFRNMDILFVLDSCHSGLGARSPPASASSINVIAACGASHTAQMRGHAISFSQRFAGTSHYELRKSA